MCGGDERLVAKLNDDCIRALASSAYPASKAAADAGGVIVIVDRYIGRSRRSDVIGSRPGHQEDLTRRDFLRGPHRMTHQRCITPVLEQFAGAEASREACGQHDDVDTLISHFAG